MQTFLPYQDFSKSASVLDDKRLNNQINEALIILRTLTGWYSKNGGKGWPNHPNVKMWQGYEASLCEYGYKLVNEWMMRQVSSRLGSGSVRKGKFSRAIWLNLEEYKKWSYDNWVLPEWLNEDFCRGHRKLLLEKDFAFYSGKFDALEIGEYNVLA